MNEDGLPQVTIRESGGELNSVFCNSVLPLKTWRHFVVTADGNRLRLYEDGLPVASGSCEKMAASVDETVWFGIDAKGHGLWNGRIDELALFDKAISDAEVAELYQSAVEEMESLK